MAVHHSRRARRGRRPLRRPGHRPRRRLRAERRDHPHRHRPVVDLEEHQGRRADRGRLPPGAACPRGGRARGAPGGRRSLSARRASPGPRRSPSGSRLPAPLRAGATSVIKPQYVIQEISNLDAGRGLHRHRGRPAPDVGGPVLQVQAPAQWCTSGGLGTMGYGLPTAMGVAGRATRASSSSTSTATAPSP